MTVNAKLHRAYDFRALPEPMRVEFHDPECTCRVCAGHAPAVRPIEPELTFVELGWIAWAAILVVSAVFFAIDPHGAWHALASCFWRQ